MQQAIENYAQYLAGSDAWALARFVLPVSRFEEFETVMRSVRTIEPWCVAALLGTSPESDLAEIDRFNERNQGRAVVDTVEVKASTADEVCHIRAFVRGSITSYFEIAPSCANELLPTIQAIHCRAKIRTGGVTPNAFPSAESVAGFMLDCAQQHVAFKATAGLHHPLRCIKPLTYAEDAPTGLMHGFLNVFLAAVFAKKQMPIETLIELLESREPSQFRFEDECLYWRDHSVTAGNIRDARRHFAISFGSCSFEEPLSDLRQLELL